MQIKQIQKPLKILLLVVENREYVFTEYAKWLVAMMGNRQVGGILFWNEPQRKPIWYMRKKMLEQAVKTDCTHVLFVDTDVIPPENFLGTLIKHGKDFISGIYYDSFGNPNSIKDGKRYQGKGLEEVDTNGMGLCLISRAVLDKVPYPGLDEQHPKIDADKEFCDHIKKAGFGVWQDFDCKGHHLLVVDTLTLI